MKRCRWVEPVLVAQIKFTEWTLDNQLRQHELTNRQRTSFVTPLAGGLLDEDARY
jgi:hypothetical protein